MDRRTELLELLLSPLTTTPNQFKVTVTQSPAGEGSAESCLPFVDEARDWRSTLLRTLELISFKPEYFTTTEQDWMVETRLLSENRQTFHPDLRKTIGQVLYRALVPPNSRVEKLLDQSIQIARTRGVQLLVQLKFEEDAVQVARLPDYPWELIHDGTGFLLHNQVGFSRYIAFPAVPPRLPAVEQVNVLLISSGASDKALGLKPLPKKERAAIAEALKGTERIRLEDLPKPTLDGLAAYLTQRSGKDAPHLLHFDGHGLFGKQCSACHTLHKGIKLQQCKNCSVPLPDAQGYLLFEDENGKPDYVSASQLGTLLQQTRQSDGGYQTGGVAALVLSACQSGMAVEGESLFQGTAQNLIYNGVPAVIAMQYSVSVEGAIAFAKQFYRSIGERNSLAVAVSQGRMMMRVDENQWYRPVLYLRWRDNEGGNLFSSVAPLQSSLQQVSAEPNSQRKPITSIDTFCDFITWIYDKSHGLGLQEVCQELRLRSREQLREAIQKACIRNSQSEDVGLEVLEIVVHYYFYCLEQRLSPKFGRISKKAYRSKIEDIVNSGRKIKSGNILLSSLVNEHCLSKLISKLEKYEF